MCTHIILDSCFEKLKRKWKEKQTQSQTIFLLGWSRNINHMNKYFPDELNSMSQWVLGVSY